MPTLYRATVEPLSSNVEPNNKTTFSLEEIQAYVKGYFEMIALPQGQVMLVNEDAIRLEMPYNKAASELAGGPILGDALVCDRSFLE